MKGVGEVHPVRVPLQSLVEAMRPFYVNRLHAEDAPQRAFHFGWREAVDALEHPPAFRHDEVGEEAGHGGEQVAGLRTLRRVVGLGA